MGNVESSSYQKCLLRFLPEEQKEIDEAFDSLSGEKNEKASRKTVNLQQLKAFVFKGFPESMTVRLYDGMRSIRVSAKASGLSEQISKEQFTVFLSELLRGTAEEKSYIVSRMILGDGSEIVKERQVQEFTEDLIMSVVYLLKHKKLMKGWNLENTQDYVAGGKVLAAQLLLELRSPGDNRCFLFSVFPRLEVYTYTGYNDHYMYLNHGQQTMPNGLGMGGQHNYFGLWIDSNYGKGHSKAKPKCTTYNSPQLSAQDDFLLDALEVWAVGDLPESVLLKGKTSILDVDPEAQALLEMTGKSRQSAGLRDQVEEDEN
ncbi:MTOR-associated protein MEAK7-like isoform X2 [Microcaecilia unicolor]|uniref:MTOR-associated protein MEAK7 n=1 Tax=Microcaecilia unicolor TaxID=1415580 RepID=A0A6P7X456_9AMPH|nr:MTOR-associated protein MEAK7-like isoform X2 [Microcaecilia unicolor]